MKWRWGALAGLLALGTAHAQAVDVGIDGADMLASFLRFPGGRVPGSLLIFGAGLVAWRCLRRLWVNWRWRRRHGPTWLAIATVKRKRAVRLGFSDTEDFELLVSNLCECWNRRDMLRLKALTTGDLGADLERRLADLESRGLSNQVSEFKLQGMKLVETWAEGAREFAALTISMQLIDATYDQAGTLSAGSERVQHVSEMWTFNRRPQQVWRVAAIDRP